MLNKKDLRLQMRQKLQALGEEKIKALSHQATEHLKTYLESRSILTNQLTIGAFVPLDKEISVVTNLIKAIWSFPILENEQMKFAIPAGKIDSPWLTEWQKITQPSVLIVPALAFDKSGSRLGRGKGYFDRYLENFSGIKIGFCWQEQIIEELPIDDHDQRVDLIVNNHGVLFPKSNEG